MSFDQAYAGADWSKYENLPAFAETHRRNANAVFLEMEAAMFWPEFPVTTEGDEDERSRCLRGQDEGEDR